MRKSFNHIRHRISSGWLHYTDQGVVYQPYFRRNIWEVPWSEIDFVSPTPAVQRVTSGWYTYDHRNLMADDALQKLSFLTFHIVVKDYHRIEYSKTVLDKIWGHHSFPIFEQLAGADDQPEPKRAAFRYTLKKRSLNVPLRSLLDFIQQNSRYDLLCLDVDF